MKQEQLDKFIQKELNTSSSSSLFGDNKKKPKRQTLKEWQEENRSSPKAIRKAAIKILSRREHSSQELIQKLSRYYDPDVIPDVIQELQDNDWQSESRFAYMWVRSRANRGYGPQRVTQELKQKGITGHLLIDAMIQEEIDWYTLGQETYDKKYGNKDLPEDSAKHWNEKAKRMNFMQYRGFSQEHYRI